MRKYEHIFFDLDHTLWDFETNSKQTLNELFLKYDLGSSTSFEFEDFYQKYKFYNRNLWKDYELGKIDKDELRVSRFQKALLSIGIDDLALSITFGDDYVKYSPIKKALIPHSMDVLNYLSEKGYKLHIITNGFEEVQHIKLKNSELDVFFIHTITSEKAGAKKPSMGVFNYAFELTGANKRNSVIIGDSYHSDIVGGMNIGMDTIYFNPESESYHKKPTYDISCLSDIYEIL